MILLIMLDTKTRQLVLQFKIFTSAAKSYLWQWISWPFSLQIVKSILVLSKLHFILSLFVQSVAIVDCWRGHTRIRWSFWPHTSTAAMLSFATFIFDGQSNFMVQMSRFLCVIATKINPILEIYFFLTESNSFRSYYVSWGNCSHCFF